MSIVREAERVKIETPGGNHSSGLATPAHGVERVSLIRQMQQPGGTNPPHYHDHEEVLYLLAGQVQATVDGKTVDLFPGDTLIVPANKPHYVRAVGATAAEWLLVAPVERRFFSATGEEMFPEWAR